MNDEKHLPYMWLTAIFCGLLFYFIHECPKPTGIKPHECNCVTYSQYALWSEKYNRFVSENKPDSVAKYAELLNQIK